MGIPDLFFMKVVKIDKLLPTPGYTTKGAGGLDLYSRLDVEITPKNPTFIPLNVIIEIPEGYVGLLIARSSLARNKGLALVNGIGVIDSDFTGPEDEIQAEVITVGDMTAYVNRGDKIAQLLIVPTLYVGGQPTVELVDVIGKKN